CRTWLPVRKSYLGDTPSTPPSGHLSVHSLMSLRSLLLGILFCPVLGFGQSDRIEVACDTVVFGHRYTRCITNGNGHFVEFGNRDAEQQRHGLWCEVRGDSASSTVTEYHHGSRVRERWRRGCLWRYDENGDIISKGKADRRNRPIF